MHPEHMKLVVMTRDRAIAALDHLEEVEPVDA